MEDDLTTPPQPAKDDLRADLLQALQQAFDSGRNKGFLEGQESERRSIREALAEVVGESPADLDEPIDRLEISERVRRLLTKKQINTLADLVDHTEKDLSLITNFGPKSLEEVVEVLKKRGLKLSRQEPYAQRQRQNGSG